MALQIDDAFISSWEQRYDEGDEPEYERLTKLVSTETQRQGTVCKQTFLDIWKWKGAMRVIRFTSIYVDGYKTKAGTSAECQYNLLYKTAVQRAASAPPDKKLDELLAPGQKLPGVGAPTASTIIHFIHPETMPIIDVRTVEVLYHARIIRTKARDLEHYEEFRRAMNGIRERCSPGWTLRQIDWALFAYHKYKLGKEERACKT